MGRVKAMAVAIEEEMQRQATAAAISSARKLIGGAVPAGTPAGKLSETELGWLVIAGLSAWIAKRGEQASRDGYDLTRIEKLVRNTGQVPEPWDVGAVAAILPRLASTPGIDWSLPLKDWPRDTMVQFLCAALGLVRDSMARRDAHGSITRPATVLNDNVPL